MRVVAAGLVLCAAGCSFRERLLEGPDPVDGGAVVDSSLPRDAVAGMIDGPVPFPDAPGTPDAMVDCSWEITPTNFDPCALPASNGDAVQGAGATFDTDTGVASFADGTQATPISALLPQTGATSMRVLVFGSFVVDAPIRVVGSHPLLLVGLQAIEIRGAGAIDVAAAQAGDRSVAGAGGDDLVACAQGQGGAGRAPGRDVDGGGGGGGGYGAQGGDGGDGGGDDGDGGGGGEPGPTSGSGRIMPLRGGCPGGTGGAGRGGVGGAAGAGGGAIQITARERISISNGGRVMASGGGGLTAGGIAGGGGGGSGGAILLEAPQVTVSSSALLCANGGSGAEGSGGASGTTGSCDLFFPAHTPNSSQPGGNGGDGGTLLSPRGDNGGRGSSSNTIGGGGGGGGGVGRIRIRATDHLSLSGGVTPDPRLD